MNREWVTLAFGIALVSSVAVVSVWQNYPAEPSEAATPATEQPASEIPAQEQPQAPARRAAATRPAQNTATASPAAPKLDAHVPVVHKHRFGDCEGTLRAVPGTLTYATAHKDDGFQLAFAEIEAFDLDADKKNLRIRRRGGKTWNFTTRGDATAALLTFHKDASRAKR